MLLLHAAMHKNMKSVKVLRVHEVPMPAHKQIMWFSRGIGP